VVVGARDARRTLEAPVLAALREPSGARAGDWRLAQIEDDRTVLDVSTATAAECVLDALLEFAVGEFERAVAAGTPQTWAAGAVVGAGRGASAAFAAQRSGDGDADGDAEFAGLVTAAADDADGDAVADGGGGHGELLGRGSEGCIRV
jgi:hypothetical protein